MNRAEIKHCDDQNDERRGQVIRRHNVQLSEETLSALCFICLKVFK